MILVRKKKEDYIKGGQKAITDTADLLEGGIKKIDDLENPVIDKATSKMKKRILGYTRPLKTIFNKNKEFSRKTLVSIISKDSSNATDSSNEHIAKRLKRSSDIAYYRTGNRRNSEATTGGSLTCISYKKTPKVINQSKFREDSLFDESELGPKIKKIPRESSNHLPRTIRKTKIGDKETTQIVDTSGRKLESRIKQLPLDLFEGNR